MEEHVNSDISKKITQRIKEEKSLIEKILEAFPGYKGYREKELLRETDRLVRETLYRQVREILYQLREIYRELVYKESEEVKNAERLISKMDRVAEKIHHAEYGYAGLMEPIEVNQEEIENLIKFDAGLAGIIGEIKIKTEEIKSNIEDDIKDLLVEFEKLLDKLESEFNKRKEYIYMIYRGDETGS